MTAGATVNGVSATAGEAPSTVLTLEDRWPLAADWPCCTPHCRVWREGDGSYEWEPEHNEDCPSRFP